MNDPKAPWRATAAGNGRLLAYAGFFTAVFLGD